MKNAFRILLFILLAGAAGIAAAAQAGASRQLPAQAQKPPDVVAEEGMPQLKVAPPAKGKAAGPLRRATPQPPPDIAAEQQAEAQLRDLGPPPGKAKPDALLKIIESRPGGKDRADAARQRVPPGKQARPGPGKPRPDPKSASAEALGRYVDRLLGFLVPSAYAGETLTIDLTPQVDGIGRHAGLYSSSPLAYAYLYGAQVSFSYPRNDSIRLFSNSFTSLGHSVSHPYANLAVNIPATGWYILDVNANVYGNAPIAIHHYESGSYPVVESLPRQIGWADYPTLQYLEAGNHYFYWVFESTAYVSRLSVDSYP